MSNILTCEYCGMAYPACVYCGMAHSESIPSHGAQILTDHIKICEKHSVGEAEIKISKLKSALVGLIGASERGELEQMEVAIRLIPAPEEDKIKTINAIHILLEMLGDINGN